MFFKLVGYDLKNGLLKSWKKYLVAFFLFLLFNLDLFLKFRYYRMDTGTLTLGDYIFFPAAGMRKYTPDPQNPFPLPIVWLCFLIPIFYIVLYYPFLDLGGFGKSILINSGKRKVWWLSKCVWIICSVIVYYVLAWAASLLFSVLAGAKLSLLPTDQVLMACGVMDLEMVLPIQSLFPVVVTQLLVTVSLALLQQTLSLFVKPLYSFALTVSFLFLAAYFKVPPLIGNYAMLVRLSSWSKTGFHPLVGIGLSAFVGAVSILVGLYRFKQSDILNKE
jgi:hypothetical protein